MPITEAVYGRRPTFNGTTEYREHAAPVYESVSYDSLKSLSRRVPSLRPLVRRHPGGK